MTFFVSHAACNIDVDLDVPKSEVIASGDPSFPPKSVQMGKCPTVLTLGVNANGRFMHRLRYKLRSEPKPMHLTQVG